MVVLNDINHHIVKATCNYYLFASKNWDDTDQGIAFHPNNYLSFNKVASFKKATKRVQKILSCAIKFVISHKYSNQSGFCAIADSYRKRLKILVSLVRFQLIPQKFKRSFSNEKGLFSYI